MTRIDEIAEHVYRISTPIPPSPALGPGFTFNQFLIVDDEPTMFHTGMAKLFPAVRDAVATVMPVDKLRWVAYSHFEADECGSMEHWLAAAPNARPLTGRIGGMISGMTWDRETRAMTDGETLSIGKKRLRWHEAPHLPHGWDAGFMSELTTRTLFCGDLFTQPGADHPAVSEHDIVGPSEAMRGMMDYYSNVATAVVQLERLATSEPALLACMHGTSYRGDGASALRELGRALTASKVAS